MNSRNINSLAPLLSTDLYIIWKQRCCRIHHNCYIASLQSLTALLIHSTKIENKITAMHLFLLLMSLFLDFQVKIKSDVKSHLCFVCLVPTIICIYSDYRQSLSFWLLRLCLYKSFKNPFHPSFHQLIYLRDIRQCRVLFQLTVLRLLF